DGQSSSIGLPTRDPILQSSNSRWQSQQLWSGRQPLFRRPAAMPELPLPPPDGPGGDHTLCCVIRYVLIPFSCDFSTRWHIKTALSKCGRSAVSLFKSNDLGAICRSHLMRSSTTQMQIAAVQRILLNDFHGSQIRWRKLLSCSNSK